MFCLECLVVTDAEGVGTKVSGIQDLVVDLTEGLTGGLCSPTVHPSSCSVVDVYLSYGMKGRKERSYIVSSLARLMRCSNLGGSENFRTRSCMNVRLITSKYVQ